MAKNEIIAEMTAEAGYEKAICWLSEQSDVLSAMTMTSLDRRRNSGADKPIIEPQEGGASFKNSYCNYTIRLDRFLGTRPVYEIESNGYCGQVARRVKTLVVQAIQGWDMGSCRIPVQPFISIPIKFTGADIIDMPIHINCDNRPDDQFCDIFISEKNKPQFDKPVSMSESRYRQWGREKDKYAGIIGVFQGGIYFDQPNSKITDRDSLSEKVERFRRSTLPSFNFSRITGRKPRANDKVPGACPAVQIEFYVDRSGSKNFGMVRITNNCTVRCFEGGPYDCMIDSADDGRDYKKYDIYGYHYVDKVHRAITSKVEQSYVKQQIGTSSGRTVESEPGGQIFVDGNVIIGGATDSNGKVVIEGKTYQTRLKGRLTVIATGNIWIVNSLEYDGKQDTTLVDGVPVKQPAFDNPNALGLFSQNGVVKVVDPGQSLSGPPDYDGLKYQPIGYHLSPEAANYARLLPNPMVVQAAITVCGGGWGAENVGHHKVHRLNTNPSGDSLIVVGAITEAVRGLVGQGQNGFKKFYFFDERFLSGILPGDMWLQGKFVPATAGWDDCRL